MTVVRFEVGRTLKSPFFWFGALLGPLMMVLFVLATGSAGALIASDSDPGRTPLRVTYVDDSGFVDQTVAMKYQANSVADVTEGVRSVQAGEADMFVHYPQDLTGEVIDVRGANIGITGYLSYQSRARAILRESVVTRVGDTAAVAVLEGETQTNVVMYDGNKEAAGLGGIIPLILFPAVFYLVFFLQGNRMVTAPLEEKQNRVTEMILTTITASALLVGKVLSVIFVGLVQMAVIAVPCAVGLVVLDGRGLPELTWELSLIAVNSVLLVSGFLLFAALHVAIGAAVPTEKDAQSLFATLLMILLFPLMLFVVLVLLAPGSVIIEVLTYFPLTGAPIAMLRVAIGTLGIWQGAVVAGISLVCAILVFRVAAGLFQFGSIEYVRKISLRSALSHR
jgi:ABC-2 type transport system permease protein